MDADGERHAPRLVGLQLNRVEHSSGSRWQWFQKQFETPLGSYARNKNPLVLAVF